MRLPIKAHHLEDISGHSHDTVMMFDIMMPLEIKLDFTPETPNDDPTAVIWTVSRDMMVDAVMNRKPGGIGDVKMRTEITEHGAMFVLDMSVWDNVRDRSQGQMTLAFFRTPVENFLRKTLAVRPQHVDDLIVAKQVDLFLMRLLA